MTTTPMRIGGWLLAPLAWLIMTLFSAFLSVAFYFMVLITPEVYKKLSARPVSDISLWYLSMACAIALFAYTLWLTIAFFKRRLLVRKHYIIWLLITVLLAVKAFAFAPVSDAVAVRQLLFPLIAAALLAPYFRRSTRVKSTFVNP